MPKPKQTAFTPGPWHEFAYEVRDEKNNLPICTLTGKASGYRDMTEDAANQCLISAVPDLLAALQDLAAQMQDAIHTNEENPDEGLKPSQGDKDALKAARAAILKATEGK